MPAINWRMSAALENVPRGDTDIAEVTSLEEAVREWLRLDLQHQTNATITLEEPVQLHQGEGSASFSGDAIRAVADRLPASD
ncbi:MAG: hypothetical protein EOO81_08840 [Oxalobacteraceae bacterium]|nr:MAG: hypothetical protein EOO81_08840 [Oxalobacteraceae bacterium]